MEIIFLIVGLVAGAGIGFLLARNGSAAQAAKADMMEQNLKEQKAESERQLNDLRAQHQQALQRTEEQHRKEVEQCRADLTSLKDEHKQRIAELLQQHQEQVTQLREQQREQLQAIDKQHKEDMAQQATLLREQIQNASEEILKKRSEELASTNKLQLSTILTPLHENLKQMKEAVEKSDREHTTSMERLDASIKANLKQAQEVGERADKLAKALTSENKTQGNFGELRLRTLLEEMGLEEGTQFEEQTALKDAYGKTIVDAEEGHRMIPDVILHFPEHRDVIIDSKMSLKAFEDYHNAETDEQRADALSRHLISVRKHVDELARKDYSSYLEQNHQQLDFVLMYIYSESALQLALSQDASLWKYAYDKGVIITGSQNLYMMLRVLVMTWRQVQQAENQAEIMKTANELVNRIQMFYERFQQAENCLSKTQTAFNDLHNISAPTGRSISNAAMKLIKYGAKENPKRKYSIKANASDDDATEALPSETEEA